jgi:hypothetical protein
MDATENREFDAPWKDALEWYLSLILRILFPKFHERIDWSVPHVSLDGELQRILRKSDAGKSRVDKLFRLKSKKGKNIHVLVHIEVQSQREKDFAKRMFQYSCRLRDRYKIDVESLAVLGDDSPSWRPTRYRHRNNTTKTVFHFTIAKLIDWLDRMEELESDPSCIGLIIAAHLQSLLTHRNFDARRASKYRLCCQLIERGLEAEEIRKLFTIIDWFLELPKDFEEEFRNDIAQFEKEKTMPVMGSFEKMVRAEGEAIGVAKGEAIGVAKGEASGAARVLKVLLEVRFGTEGIQYGEELSKRADTDWVSKLESAIRNARSIEELRSMMASV